jgi:4-hydroxythreonine-4-phosphate dehydrogenase
MKTAPRLLLTMGDVAGVGPEILARSWPELTSLCRPVVVGDPGWMRKALRILSVPAEVQVIQEPEKARPSEGLIPCLAGTNQKLETVESGRVTAAGGRAAYDFLCKAIDLTQARRADGIVTAPLHKEGLRAAGLPYPGHTEILAERTGTRQFGMMLYARGPAGLPPDGLGVVHVTLHMALRDVFRHLTTAAVLEKVHLIDGLLTRLLGRRPRLAVTALNPHASDGGLFGDEERLLIEPAVTAARAEGFLVTGPWPCDTLFVRARNGEFDGVVAMYHDQGHIALKLLGGLSAVNISVGLPIVRTSVAHGTAYDIAGRGIADARSMVEAVRVASRLTSKG